MQGTKIHVTDQEPRNLSSLLKVRRVSGWTLSRSPAHQSKRFPRRRREIRIDLGAEQVDELEPRDQFSTQAHQVRSCHLTIDDVVTALNELVAQALEGDLGCVAFEAEHRLAKEDVTKRDAVESADEPPIEPSFDRMRIAELVQA